VSVLTDEAFFGRTLADLTAVAGQYRAGLETHRGRLQVLEARAAGAARCCSSSGPWTDGSGTSPRSQGSGSDLVEAHTERGGAGWRWASVVGVNSRDLDTFVVDLAVAERLLPLVPAGVPAVGESGVRSAADVERLARAGADAVLVGGALSVAGDPAAAVRALARVPRRGRAVPAERRP
jgi:indole-3-glycerol phosphate synthase